MSKATMKNRQIKILKALLSTPEGRALLAKSMSNPQLPASWQNALEEIINERSSKD